MTPAEAPQTLEQILLTLSDRMTVLSREIRILNEDRQEATRKANRRWRVAAVALGIVLIILVVAAILAFAGGHVILVCS
jgi:uncharacterized membrane protein